MQIVNEVFDRKTLHPRLNWLNPPSIWRIDDSGPRLLLEPDANTDFWQQTHYGFRADNGHFLYAEIPGDAIATTEIHCHPAHQYDQAGLMVRFSAACWLKAANEFAPEGPSQLGTVVTNFGFSDWSLQNFPYGKTLSYRLRIRREGLDFFVEHAAAGSESWNLMRIARLHPDSTSSAQVGLYACSPKGGGCHVEIKFLRIESA